MSSSIARAAADFVTRTVKVLVLVARLYLSFFIVVTATFSSQGDGPTMVLATIAIVFLLNAVSVTVHEVGHAAAAYLVGWRVHLIVVWPIGYLIQRGTFRLVSRAERKHLSGWVMATPPVGPHWDRGRAAFYFGGAAANIICAAICFGALDAFSGMTRGLVAALGVISAAMAIGNLIPSEVPRRNDGAMLLGLAKGARTSQFDADNAWTTGYLLDCLDRSLWDQNLIRRLQTDREGDIPAQSRDVVLLGRYLALGDVVRAHAMLESSSSTQYGATPEFAFTKAFLVAIVERDPVKAASVLDDVPKNARARSYLYWRARMTIDAVRGDIEQSRAAAKAARRFARKEGSLLDNDERVLLEACELGEPLPLQFSRGAA